MTREITFSNLQVAVMFFCYSIFSRMFLVFVFSKLALRIIYIYLLHSNVTLFTGTLLPEY